MKRSARRARFAPTVLTVLTVLTVAALATPAAPAYAAATNTMLAETGIGWSRLTFHSRDREQRSTYVLEALAPPAVQYPTTRLTGTIHRWVTGDDGHRRFERRELDLQWVWRDLFYYSKLEPLRPGYQVGEPIDRTFFGDGLDKMPFLQPTCDVGPAYFGGPTRARCRVQSTEKGGFEQRPIFDAHILLGLQGFDSDQLFYSPAQRIGLHIEKSQSKAIGVAAWTDIVEEVTTDCRPGEPDATCGKPRYVDETFQYALGYTVGGDGPIALGYSCVNETYDGPSCDQSQLNPFSHRLYPQRDVHLVYSFESGRRGRLVWTSYPEPR